MVKHGPHGFAALVATDPARQHEIARKGGKAAHERGTAHEWTSDEARAAGRKGGLAKRGYRPASADGQATPADV